MRKVFGSQYKITQEFGVNADYYKQFKLAGHEGIDLIPSGSVFDIYALEDGVVVLDDDVVGSVSSDPYGKIVTLWHPNIKKATMYCHLTENYVSMGQQVKRGDKIAKMGSTGNSTGPHLHLNLFEVDDQGVRLNRNNGYLGGINPKPFLEETVVDQAQPQQAEIDELRKARDDNWNLYQAQIGETAMRQERLEQLEEENSQIKKEKDQLTKDVNSCENHAGELLDQLTKINDTDKNTSEQLLDAQHALQPLKDALLAINRALGLMDDTDSQTTLKALQLLKDSKVKPMKKPVTFLDKILFLLT